jgi:hypothetical protein
MGTSALRRAKGVLLDPLTDAAANRDERVRNDLKELGF